MSRVSSHAPVARAATPKPLAEKPKADKKHAAPSDSFKTGKAHKLDPLRPATAAVTFVKKFEDGLKLSPKVEKLRVANMKASPISFFRANPGLFFMDQRQ